MQRADLQKLLSHGSAIELAEAARALAQADPRQDGDVFLKKAEAWAYQAYFLSTLNVVEEAQGRFAVVPVDGLVMGFLEEGVAPSNRLPTGHLYEPALHSAMEALTQLLGSDLADDATEVLELLDRDIAMRDYLLERRLEHFFS